MAFDDDRVASSHPCDERYSILRVSPDDDGSWQFHYGGPVSTKDACLALEEIVELILQLLLWQIFRNISQPEESFIGLKFRKSA